ncbi:unnamed protein product [Ectocarpus sp. 13 AM-2016]
MGQAASCCSFCCPCLLRRKAAAVPGATTEDQSKLLPSSSTNKAHKPRKEKCSKYRRPPSHLRELSGDINQVVRLVLVGGCDTGKTCLLRRFLGGYFDDIGHQDYTRQVTLGVDFGCRTVDLVDRRVRLQMWDTGGSETYRSVVSHYLRGADGVMMCFDVNSKETLRSLRSTWAPFLDKHTPRTCRVLLAGNKADARGDFGVNGGEVSHEDAKCFAEAMEAQVFETSAKLGTNVDVAVMALMQEVLHHRQFAAKDKPGSSKKGSSPARRGRKRLSVALKGVMEHKGDRDTASSCAAQSVIGRSPANALCADATNTEGTSSVYSSASHRDDDSSDQENNCRDQEDHGRMWSMLPSIDDGIILGDGGEDRADGARQEQQQVSALDNSIDGRLSKASRDCESESGWRGGGTPPRDSAGGSSHSGFNRGGRYHLINKLIIVSPSSRGARTEDIDVRRCCDRDDQSSGGRRRQPSHVEELDGNNRGRKADNRNVTTFPKPGTIITPEVQARSMRPVAAPRDEASSRVAVGRAPAPVPDERHQLHAGGMAEAGRDLVVPERKKISVDAAVREAPPCHPPAAERSRALSEVTSPPVKKTDQERRDVHRGTHNGDSDRRSLGCNNPAIASANSSFSTVLAGHDHAHFQLASPVPEQE